MKATHKLLALALMAVAIVFTSCSKDDDNPVAPTQQEIEAKIVGKWKNIQVSDRDVLTNNRMVMSFAGNQKSYVSCSFHVPSLDVTVWGNRIPSDYNVVNQNLTFRTEYKISEKPVSLEFDFVVNKFEGVEMNTTLQRQLAPNIGVDDKQPKKMLWMNVTADYSQDIIGKWEGVELTGDETYGNAEARIEYHTDGTYTYFKKYADIWCPSENVDNEYNVDGDWLATRWRPEKGADYNYEWWDIDDVKNGTMNWSALREKENGERYTTTFTWKKVDTPTEEQYKAMILGEWEVVEGINYELKDGKLVDSTPASLGRFHVLYTFGHDDTFSMIRKDEDGTKLMEAYGHYELRGSVVSFIYERMFFMGEPLDEGEYNYGTETMGISAVDGENLTLVEYMKFEDDPDECDHLLMYMKMQRQ